jgi:hypothetical protein
MRSSRHVIHFDLDVQEPLPKRRATGIAKASTRVQAMQDIEADKATAATGGALSATAALSMARKPKGAAAKEPIALQAGPSGVTTTVTQARAKQDVEADRAAAATGGAISAAAAFGFAQRKKKKKEKKISTAGGAAAQVSEPPAAAQAAEQPPLEDVDMAEAAADDVEPSPEPEAEAERQLWMDSVEYKYCKRALDVRLERAALGVQRAKRKLKRGGRAGAPVSKESDGRSSADEVHTFAILQIDTILLKCLLEEWQVENWHANPSVCTVGFILLPVGFCFLHCVRVAEPRQ